MKIVLNSDILLGVRFVPGLLTEELSALCAICLEHRIAIAVPETALLEFERRRTVFAEQAIGRLEQAIALLDRFAIAHDDVEPREIVRIPNLVELLTATGVAVEVISPSRENFQNAHWRACNHLPPTTSKKSDEMRDLVIWMIALDVAQESGRALLVASDELFHDERADAEVRAVGLERVKDIEKAIDHLRGLRPAPERFAALLLSEIRDDLAGSGILLPKEVDHYAMSHPEFKLDDQGSLASVDFRLDVEQEGVVNFGAFVSISVREGAIIELSLSEAESATLSLPTSMITLPTSEPIDLAAIAKEAGLSDMSILGGHGESED